MGRISQKERISRARNLPAFLDSGLKATPEMRRKTFTIWERVVLIPVELVGAFKAAVIVLPLMFFLGGLGGPGRFWANTSNYGLFAVLAVMIVILVGTVLSPLLLRNRVQRDTTRSGCLL